MSRNKSFRFGNFSMHFRIKFLLFIDFPSYHIENFLGTFYVGVQNFHLLIFQIVIQYFLKHYFTADS